MADRHPPAPYERRPPDPRGGYPDARTERYRDDPSDDPRYRGPYPDDPYAAPRGRGPYPGARTQRYRDDPYEDPRYRGSYRDDPYGDDPYGDDPYGEPRGADRRYRGPYRDEPYGDPRDRGSYPGDPYDPYGDPRRGEPPDPRGYRDHKTRALPPRAGYVGADTRAIDPAAPPPGYLPYPDPRVGDPRYPLAIAGAGVAGAAGAAEAGAAGPGGAPGAVEPTVTRVLAHRTRHFSRLLRAKVVTASEADGARESGLTALLWNQVMSLAADAMITVALAGTVFFAASGSQQRGNVLQYLLITMAPFAIVAPVIGPLLDRVQHGRRLAMAATAVGRALLALEMAANFHDILVLLPCALGSLVLSKAYSVLRGSAAPRLVPPTMTLVSANARLSIFGLAASAIGGGVLAGFLKVTGSYQWGLRLTAVAFAVTAFYAIKLPKTVDSPQGGPRPMPVGGRTEPLAKLMSSARLREWSKRGFGEELLATLQAQCTLRGIIGFLTLFMAFYIQDTAHGFDAVVDLAVFAAAAGGASFVGTAIGARLSLGRPEAIGFLCAVIAAAAAVATVLMFGVAMAAGCVAVCGIGNALGKLSLDAVIQRDVEEGLRSSAFARSETFLQLAWVVGAALAVVLPAGQGQLNFLVATAVFGGAVVAVSLHWRTVRARRAAGRPAIAPYDPGYGPPHGPWPPA
jgi:MFS family permease